ncbi:MAG: beta galactosidase jelly roll domain-containing protein [Dysgonamonadaceae bacterium]|jgi:sialate O-acetylesterase|nr:beta galactosidase jelly roll domain-containing protein [Dysgonamonadaceae bacterium]
MKPIYYILFISCFIQSLNAGVKLPVLVSDGMVLQRDIPVKIWGWASPNESIALNFNGSDYKISADNDGNWTIELPPQKTGGPYSMTIEASNSITVKNILIGDVWLCSGQSNMETPVSRVMSLFGDEINSYSNPMIRYVKVPLSYSFHGAQSDIASCSWVDLTPETAQDYSALAYFFAKELFEKTKVPVGLLNSSVGGSPAEAWISEEALKPFPLLLNDMRICQSDEFVENMQRLNSLPGRRWAAVLNEQDKGLTESVRWSSTAYNDSSWKTTDLLDNSWGRNGNRPVNGVFWFRKEIDIPSGQENQMAMLYMGRIIDADSVYVNGKFAGATSYQYPPRNYKLPQGILKTGKNVIAVRLVSQSGFPGFVTDKPYKIVFENRREISLEGKWKYSNGAVMPAVTGGGISFQNKPTGLYNAMIAPLQNYAIKGILWYQGESNTDRYNEYFDLMQALISDWRSLWKKELPFLLVQLANYMNPSSFQANSKWAALRDVQLKLSQQIPNTGLAVAIDVGEWNDIHPLNKKDVGIRLALLAQNGENNLIYSGPIYESMKIEGNQIILTFKHVGSGLMIKGDALNTFVIAGEDRKFVPAKAEIKNNKIIVWSDAIAQPVAVRYAWADNPENANLYNREGLPASPFKTDE